MNNEMSIAAKFAAEMLETIRAAKAEDERLGSPEAEAARRELFYEQSGMNRIARSQ